MTCDVYRDLLVPYMEETCSEETAKMVKEHLAQCENCKKELENYQKELGDYQRELEVDIKRSEKSQKPSKPFKKIKRYILCLWAVIIIFIVLIGYAGSYYAVGKEHGFYVADQRFFHMKEENILGGVQEEFEHVFVSMYARIYYQIIDKDHYYAKQATLEEIINKSNELHTIHFDYENAKIEHFAESNHVYVNVPVTVEGDDVPMMMYVTGQREGIGKFRFTSMQISRADVLELGYSYYPYMTLLSNEFQMWPGMELFDYEVNAFEKHEVLLSDRGENLKLVDTKKRLEPGTYRYEDETPHWDGIYFDEITVYPDQMLTRTGSYAKKGMPENDINGNQLIERIKKIDEPVRYFIAVTETGEERFIETSNFEMDMDISGDSLEILDETHIKIGKYTYEKIK